jgi:hypothetical protein
MTAEIADDDKWERACHELACRAAESRYAHVWTRDAKAARENGSEVDCVYAEAFEVALEGPREVRGAHLANGAGYSTTEAWQSLAAALRKRLGLPTL